MTNGLTKKIIEKLDNKTAEYSVRDITFLICSIFNQTHLIFFKKFFNFKDFTIIFWYIRKDNNVVFLSLWNRI